MLLGLQLESSRGNAANNGAALGKTGEIPASGLGASVANCPVAGRSIDRMGLPPEFKNSSRTSR